MFSKKGCFATVWGLLNAPRHATEATLYQRLKVGVARGSVQMSVNPRKMGTVSND